MSSQSSKKYKVCVTGFGPFQGVPRNESWLAVSGLWEETLPPNIKLVTRELPVVYDIVKDEVGKLWDEEKPDLMIHVGVYKEAGQINVEKCSSNINYTYKDINEKLPEDFVCVKEGPETLETVLDVDRLCEISNGLLQENCCRGKCALSTDPGK